MNFENFAFWLQGFFEMTDSNTLSPNQVLMIKEHLKLVFKKETPNINPNTTPFKWPQDISPPPLVWPAKDDWNTNKNPNTHKIEVTCDAGGKQPLCTTEFVKILQGYVSESNGLINPVYVSGFPTTTKPNDLNVPNCSCHGMGTNPICSTVPNPNFTKTAHFEGKIMSRSGSLSRTLNNNRLC